MTFKDNPAYKPVATSSVTGVTFYQLTDITNLPLDRKIALESQIAFADGVITKELLEKIATAALKDLNETKTLTNQAVFWNNLLYRVRYPIDEDTTLRAAAVCLYIDGEEEKVESHWTDRKVHEMKLDSQLHAFFLTLGLGITKKSLGFGGESSVEEYFRNRNHTLKTLNPCP